ncbi:patatin-like phospholipase family protein [Shewanella sp. VB17]|uniref:patatin-like phospholipase family protein n=1 Tax=Shewanella sp. VB17 TaxID=2739432 RepID=UPI001566CD70|nr:patatin-like phospholipase family protein [Shewanella sp. VB17]NRD74737.1 patatin-like phospholipase family protein [Shewanella sp. VB17]
MTKDDRIKPNKIENLVFEGGGVKGSAYAGAMQVFQELGLFEQVENIGGTSAGSITAVMLAVGGGSDGLLESVENTNFAQFLNDPWGIVGDAKRIIFNYGMHSGDDFVTILKAYIGRFSGDPELTFSDLAELRQQNPDKFKNLSIIASNLTRQQAQVFNVENHPTLPIWLAVRASMSIPMLFEPVLIDGDYHVDGGLAWNYPIDLYDPMVSGNDADELVRDYNPATLGFFLEPKVLVAQGKQFKTSHYPINSLKSYGLALGSYLYETANAQHLQAEDKKRTIFIDDLGVSGTNFDLSKQRVDELISSGRQAVETYFDIKDNAAVKHQSKPEAMSE